MTTTIDDLSPVAGKRSALLQQRNAIDSKIEVLDAQIVQIIGELLASKKSRNTSPTWADIGQPLGMNKEQVHQFYALRQKRHAS